MQVTPEEWSQESSTNATWSKASKATIRTVWENTIKEERHEDMTKDRKTEKEREKEKNNGRKEQCMKSNKERNKNTKKWRETGARKNKKRKREGERMSQKNQNDKSMPHWNKSKKEITVERIMKKHQRCRRIKKNQEESSTMGYQYDEKMWTHYMTRLDKSKTWWPAVFIISVVLRVLISMTYAIVVVCYHIIANLQFTLDIM